MSEGLSVRPAYHDGICDDHRHVLWAHDSGYHAVRLYQLVDWVRSWRW